MSTIDLHTEKELLLQVANGDEAAYKTLFTLYWDRIYSTALVFTKSREMSQDLAQDVFARIWIKRQKLKDVLRFDSFLFITARNLILDRLRQKVLTCEYEVTLAEYFRDSSLIPCNKVELKEMEEIIHRGVHDLPKQQQTAFNLSRFQGLRHEEIAIQMGISKESVKSHIVRAISSLRKYVAARTAQMILLLWLIFF